MKTIKKDNLIKRYSDERAASLVKEEGWSYTSKTEWKTLVRDVNKKPKGEERDAKDVVNTDVEDKTPKSRKHYKQKKRLKMARKAEQNG